MTAVDSGSGDWGTECRLPQNTHGRFLTPPVNSYYWYRGLRYNLLRYTYMSVFWLRWQILVLMIEECSTGYNSVTPIWVFSDSRASNSGSGDRGTRYSLPSYTHMSVVWLLRQILALVIEECSTGCSVTPSWVSSDFSDRFWRWWSRGGVLPVGGDRTHLSTGGWTTVWRRPSAPSRGGRWPAVSSTDAPTGRTGEAVRGDQK